MSQGLGLATGKQRTAQSWTVFTSGLPGAAGGGSGACAKRGAGHQSHEGARKDGLDHEKSLQNQALRRASSPVQAPYDLP